MVVNIKQKSFVYWPNFLWRFWQQATQKVGSFYNITEILHTKQRKGVSKIEASRPKVDCKQQNKIDSTTKNLPNFTRTYIIFVEKRLTYCQGNWKVFIMTQKRKRLLTTHLDMLMFELWTDFRFTLWFHGFFLQN